MSGKFLVGAGPCINTPWTDFRGEVKAATLALPQVVHVPFGFPLRPIVSAMVFIPSMVSAIS
jgi:hypothetical protein